MTDTSVNDDNVHQLLVFGGLDCKDLTDGICHYLDESLQPGLRGESKTEPFPNGESMVRLKSDVRGRDVFVVLSLCRQHNADERGYTGINDCLMELLVFGDTLRRASANRITAVMPHFGYARQDRKAAGRTPITARLVADLIVQAGFNRVLTMDLHADQIQGFFPREVPLDHLNAGQLFAEYFDSLQLENAVVLSPDAGNLKKAEKYRRGFSADVGLAVVDKQRDPKTGKVMANRITGDDVQGKTIIMLDDIISTAGTMREAIDLALEHGAKEFYLACTHGEFVGKAIERLNHPAIKEIAITDTIPILSRMRHDLPLIILPISNLFGEAIRRIHEYESISELLGIYG